VRIYHGRNDQLQEHYMVWYYKVDVNNDVIKLVKGTQDICI